MRLTSLLAGSAVASVMLFAPVPGTLGLPVTSTAEAAVSVGFSVFYDGLASNGNWVRYQNDYVFIPANVRVGWKPYTDGHWVYVQEVGWTWVSNEPFGWATYHYGRWGYGDDIGWYWIPGTRWAPAWVSWRRSNDYVVWAPLPPRGGNDVSISISVGDVPDFYWVAVPTRNFLDVDLRIRLTNNDRDRARIIRDTRFLGTPRVRGDVVVNNVIDVNVIEKDTGKKVKRLRAQSTDRPQDAKATGDQVQVFRGEVKKEDNAKPARVADEKSVQKIRRQGGKAGQDNATGQQAPQNSTDQTGSTTQPPAAQDQNGQQTKQKSSDQNKAGNQQGNKTQNKKRKQPESTGASQDNATTGSSTDTGSQQKSQKTNKKRKPQVNQDQGASGNANSDQGTAQRKKPQKQENQNNQNARKKNNPDQQQLQNKSQNRKKKICDPSTDANCPAQQ